MLEGEDLLRLRVLYRAELGSRKCDRGVVTGYRTRWNIGSEVEVTGRYIRWVHVCQIIRIIPLSEGTGEE